jgi:hypothetical protein
LLGARRSPDAELDLFWVPLSRFLLALDLFLGVGLAGVDPDAPGLHLLGHFARQFDGQQTMLQIRAEYLDMIGDFEPPLEGLARNPSVQNSPAASAEF